MKIPRRHFCFRRAALLGAASATLTMAACSGESERVGLLGDGEGEGAKPLRTLNPSSRDAREFRVVVKDPPVRFTEANASVQYDVVNAAECGKKNRLSGALPGIRSSEPVELTKISDTEFKGVVFGDLIQSEDYFGEGVCRWEMVQASVGFRASTDPFATWLVASLDADDIGKNVTQITYFWSGHYPNAEIDNFADYGNPSLDHVADAEKSEFFEVVMTSRDAASASP